MAPGVVDSITHWGRPNSGGHEESLSFSDLKFQDEIANVCYTHLEPFVDRAAL